MADSNATGLDPRLEAAIDRQALMIVSAQAIVDVVANGMPDTPIGEPEFRSALFAARDLLNSALAGLDSVNLRNAVARS